MQYSLQIFETEDHNQFRIIHRDGEPWFVLADVCRALDIKNPSDAAGRLDADEKMTLALAEGQSGVRGGPRMMNVINESGLYSVILRSDKAEAKRFKKWVTATVLPSIRKTGGYRSGAALPLSPVLAPTPCVHGRAPCSGTGASDAWRLTEAGAISLPIAGETVDAGKP